MGRLTWTCILAALLPIALAGEFCGNGEVHDQDVYLLEASWGEESSVCISQSVLSEPEEQDIGDTLSNICISIPTIA